jgi:hypothetical protein
MLCILHSDFHGQEESVLGKRTTNELFPFVSRKGYFLDFSRSDVKRFSSRSDVKTLSREERAA